MRGGGAPVMMEFMKMEAAVGSASRAWTSVQAISPSC